MKMKKVCVVACIGISWVVGFSMSPSFVCGNEWIELSPMNRRRGEHGNAVVDGKIFVIGGISGNINGVDSLEQFDPVTNAWTDIGTMPSSRERHHFTIGSSVHHEEIWIVGGKTNDDNSGTTFVDVYNTVSGKWRVGPDLPELLWGGPSVVVGDSLHIFAGAQSKNNTKDLHYSLDLTDPNASWRSEPAVPSPRVHVAGTVVDDRIYIIGGEFHHSHDGDTTTVQIYDTTNQSWSFGADLPLPRSHAEWATFAHEGEIWSVSGVDSSNAPNRGQSEIFIYSPTDDQWRQFRTDLPSDLVSPGAKIIDETLYVFGGGENNWFEGDMRTTYALSLAESLEGDFNNDGLGDGADFLLWQRGELASLPSVSHVKAWQSSFGFSTGSGQALEGDFNNDGVGDGADFLSWQRGELPSTPSVSHLGAWQSSFGFSSEETQTSQAIPEPQGLILLGFGVMTILSARGCLRLL